MCRHCPRVRLVHRARLAFSLLMIILPLSWPGPARADMLIRDYQSQRHDRFYSGTDKAFLGELYDWSGVGSAGSQWVTMISPSYFLSAAHYAPSGTVTFYEGNDLSGASHSYTIASGVRIYSDGVGTDLWLGSLTTPLAAEDNISYYSILTLGSESAYFGMEIFNYGKDNRVGRNVIDDDGIQSVMVDPGPYTTDSMLYDYDDDDDPYVGGDETYLMGGDSGAPSFTVWDGELTLLGIHWFNGTYDETGVSVSGDSFVPNYVAEIAASMVGESLVTVPEPTVVLLSLCSSFAVAIVCRRRG